MYICKKNNYSKTVLTVPKGVYKGKIMKYLNLKRVMKRLAVVSILCSMLMFTVICKIFVLKRDLSIELEKRSLFYSQLINDRNGDGISDINDIKSANYNFSKVINVQPEVGGKKITVFFRSDISDFTGIGGGSEAGPNFTAEYKDGVPDESNQFVNKCVKGLIRANHFTECRYIVYISDIVNVYSDDKVHYYYENGDVSNKLMVRRAFVAVYDVSTGDCIASNIFDGRDRELRTEIRIKSISTPEANDINKFLKGIIG